MPNSEDICLSGHQGWPVYIEIDQAAETYKLIYNSKPYYFKADKQCGEIIEPEKVRLEKIAKLISEPIFKDFEGAAKNCVTKRENELKKCLRTLSGQNLSNPNSAGGPLTSDDDFDGAKNALTTCLQAFQSPTKISLTINNSMSVPYQEGSCTFVRVNKKWKFDNYTIYGREE